MLRDGSFEQFEGEFLIGNGSNQLCVISDQSVIVGTEVQLKVNTVVLFGRVEDCSPIEDGYALLVDVDETLVTNA